MLLNIIKVAPRLPYTWIKCDIKDSVANVDACIDISIRLNVISRKIDELTDCTGGLLSAAHEIIESALGRNSANFDKCARVLNDAETKYVAIQENAEIKNTLAEFRSKLNIYQSIKQWDIRQSELLEIFENEIVFIDAEGIMSRYVNDYRSKFGRIFKSRYRQDRNTLQKYIKGSRKLDYLDTIHYLEMITSTHSAMDDYYSKAQIVCGGRLLKKELMLQNEHDLKEREQALVVLTGQYMQDLRAEFEKESAELVQRSAAVKKLLSIEATVNSDYCDIKYKIETALQLREELIRLEVGDEFARKIFSREDRTLNAFIRGAEEIAEWAKIVEPWLNRFIDNFNNTTMTRLVNAELSDLAYAVRSCLDNYSFLEYLVDYQKAEMRLRDLGIGEYLDKIKDENIAARDILPCFNKCFYRSWIDAVTPKHISISAFRGERQEARIRQFRDLDKSHLEISKAALIAKLITRLPNVDSPNNGEVALLRREMAKQRKLMPTRKLIAEIPNLLPALKPCIMMSPLSVSTYLGSNSYKFDTVVFDEASQVRTEDAICAIFRAKQAIIAGDSKQLPPTDFFASSISDMGETDDEENGEINDAGAYESLLDEAAMLPPQMLRWHYRSKHEDLIAFSNTKIYDSNLVTFPSSVENTDDVGVEYVYIDGGIYDRKDKSGNKAEAARIAELVFEHFKIFPKRSLGVIAFGEVQQTAIEEEILRKRRENTQYEMFFKDGTEEPLFVKNLETVQGDERDTIILSIGYAADALGKFILNFGPISRQGGERRLNVAVTRARYNMKLVGSIMPTDIDMGRVSGIGPKLLRLYIDYAINGPKAILGEPKTNDNVSFDSIFEESVFNYLVSHGYDVATQVGCSGYRIDMAIRHPKYKGRFAIGIECDGATYHSARTARERDRLRQTILEDMGWKIYRVWSTDWIKDKHTQGQRLLLTVQSAIEEYREELREIRVPEKKVNGFIDISKKSMNEIYSERYKKIESRYAGYSANEIPEADFKETMLRVLENGFGLDKSSLFKETAQYGYLWQRQGSTIKEKFERAYRSLIQERKITEDDAKIRLLERITT